MIAEGVEHYVATPEACGEQSARGTPWIGSSRLRLKDRTRRGEESSERPRRIGDEAAEGKGGLLQARQFSLSQHRQGCQGPAARDRSEERRVGEECRSRGV